MLLMFEMFNVYVQNNVHCVSQSAVKKFARRTDAQ